MNISPYDNLPVGKKEPPQEETQQTESLQYIDVPIEDIAEDVTANEAAADTDSSENVPAENSDSEYTEASSSAAESIDTLPSEPELKPEVKQKTAGLPHRMHETSAEPISTPHESIDFAKITPLTSSSQYSKLKIKNMWNTAEYMLPFEETLLVPDTMPDMTDILFTEGSVSPAQPNKSSYEKTDTVSCEIVLYTVYAPAATSTAPVDVIKSTVPFRTDKCWENTEGNSFKVSLSIKSVSAEMLNERKFTVKGLICIHITEIAQKDLMLFTGTGDNDLIQNTNSLIATNLVFEANETTEISQEINLHEDQPAPLKILKEHFDITENHKQITSGKLVINGTILADILYLGQEDDKKKLCSFKNKIDFTQFIAIEDNLNSELIQTSFIGDNIKATIESENQFLIQGKIITAICGYENKKIPIVSDVYHRKQDVKFDTSQQPLSFIKDTVFGEVSSREIVNTEETGKKPEILLCGSVNINDINAAAERGRIIIEGTADVKILALNENDDPFIINSTVPLRGSLEMAEASEDLEISVSSAIKEFWFDSINSRQLEINIGVSLEVWAARQQIFQTIENLCFVEMKSPQKNIPMAIYVVSQGDTLWDIAKRYKTDIENLSLLNQIDTDKHLTEGTKLLIIK